jgi:ABC-type Fe3+/spermidine/putrescine transport system ATPase subunit
MSREAAIGLVGLKAGYRGIPVVRGVELAVEPGELVAVLGSSGCGKTTMLRTIAGFQPALGGEVRLFGRDVTRLPPEKRGVAMVFQSYALWPHMTVLGNIGYGLKLRGMDSDAIRARVAAILAMLNLSGLEERKVTDLSGGQRQRVALGRALAIEPRVLLLDEPLSNLDAKVRLQLRGEIKALQRSLGFAALHVTHDREEAMTMADRIVIMDQGHIAQVGTPEAVYDAPLSPFVASFMGAENTIELEVAEGAAGTGLRLPGSERTVNWQGPASARRMIAYFREDVARLGDTSSAGADEIVLPGTITARAYPGGHYRYTIAVDGRQYSVKDTALHSVGSRIGICLPLRSLHLFPANGEHTQGRMET